MSSFPTVSFTIWNWISHHPVLSLTDHCTQLFPIIIVPSCSVLVLLDVYVFPVCVSMCTESLFYVTTLWSSVFLAGFLVMFVYFVFGLITWTLNLAWMTTRWIALN